MSLRSFTTSRVALLCVMGLVATTTVARAEPARIVVIGASNAAGTAVGSSAAWPAQLENMLRAKGYDVSISVRAVAGAGSAQVLAQAGSIPSGTAVVVYDVGGGNDRDHGVSHDTTRATRAQIEARIRAAGARPVPANYGSILGPEGTSAWIAGDRHHHFTAQSHRRVAAALLPRVIAVLPKR